jgi:hypothetical protein
MMISFSLKGLGSTTGVRRLFVAAAGVGAVLAAIYRAPAWLETWNTGVVVGAMGAAVAFLILALAIAVRGSADAVKRVAMEASLFACALIVAEVILLGLAPEKWSDSSLVQQFVSRERAALEQGIAYDERVRAEVVRDLRSRGVDAVPGFPQGIGWNPAVTGAIRERGLLPLSNVSNAHVVECNEGTGYLQFQSDEFGFNNPPGLAAGPVDVAVLGESLALGHCVAPSTSAVALVRARFPRTANFGVTGSRVLSQLGVFREYVEPLEPRIVVWFVHTNFADPREETSQPVLMSYLNNSAFSQRLRQRQVEIDSFLRELVVPLTLQRGERLRDELDRADAFPVDRVVKLAEVRSLVDFGPASHRPIAEPDLSHFKRAVDLVVDTARGWNGSVILVILPSYELVMEGPQDVARYEAILHTIDPSSVGVVDGAALFAAHPDVRSLFTLGIDNHPSEQGHALLADAVVAAIKSRTHP